MNFKKSILAALLCATGLTTQASATTVVFEQEMLGSGSNDTLASAQNLGTLFANSDLSVFGSRFSSLAGGTSVDYFGFTLGNSLTVNFAVNTPYGASYRNDPIVGLFNQTGTLITYDDDGGPGYDSFLTKTLSSGKYYVAVSGFSNFSFTGDSGSGNWPYELKISATAPVPEPESYAMFLAGLGIVGAVARRRRSV